MNVGDPCRARKFISERASNTRGDNTPTLLAARGDKLIVVRLGDSQWDYYVALTLGAETFGVTAAEVESVNRMESLRPDTDEAAASMESEDD